MKFKSIGLSNKDISISASKSSTNNDKYSEEIKGLSNKDKNSTPFQESINNDKRSEETIYLSNKDISESASISSIKIIDIQKKVKA